MEAVNKKTIAEALGVDERTITRWIDGEHFPCIGIGRASKFDIPACIQWYAKHRISKEVSTTAGGENISAIEKARVKYLEVKTRQEQLKEYKIARELITVDEADAKAEAYLVKFSNWLKALPGSWSPALIGIKNRAEAVKRLQDLLEPGLNYLANPQDVEEGEIEGTTIPEDTDEDEDNNGELEIPDIPIDDQ